MRKGCSIHHRLLRRRIARRKLQIRFTRRSASTGFAAKCLGSYVRLLYAMEV